MPTKRARKSGQSASETSPLLPKRSRSGSHQDEVIYESRDPSDSNAAKLSNLPDSTDQNDLERRNTEGGVSGNKGPRSPPDVTRRVKLLFPVLAVGMFLSGCDNTFTISSAAKISGDLGSLSKSSWIATAYLLALTSFQPLYGKFSDIFGRKPCILFAYGVFSIGCIICGVARSMDELIAARAIQGLGGGGMTSLLSILLSDTIPLKDRGTWQGFFNLTFATGAGLGAPLGGLLADTIGWRWSFLTQAPISIIALVIIALALKLPQLEEMSWKKKLKRVDFLGSFLLVTAVACLVFGMDRGGNEAWSDKWTITTLCVSIPLFAVFAFVESKFASEPVAPPRIVLGRTLVAALFCNFFAYAGWFGSVFYVPRYFEAVERMSTSKSGSLMLPGVFASVVGSLLSGYYMKRIGKYYYITVAAFVGLVLGMVVIILCSGLITSSAIGICIGLAISGLCNGIQSTCTLISLIANASHSDQAVATACSYLFRSLGSTMGVSITSAAANLALRKSLQSALKNGGRADEIVRKARDNLAFIDTLDPKTRRIVIQCYSLSTRAAFILAGVMLLGGVVCSWFITEKTLSETLPGDEGAENENDPRSEDI